MQSKDSANKYQPGKTYWVKANKVKPTQWNPERRTNPEISVFRTLVKSIAREGQQAPIIIDPDGRIIDGNRRAAACLTLGIKVWCVVSDKDAVSAYRILNSSDTQKPIRGNAILNVYLLKPEAIQRRTREKIDIMFSVLGLDRFRDFYNDGGNLSTWNEARNLSSYIMTNDVGKVALWMARHKQSLRSRIARKTGLSPEFLKSKIMENVPLQDEDNMISSPQGTLFQP